MKTNIKLLVNSGEPFAVLVDSFKNGKYTCYSFDDNTHFDATHSYINESKNINNKLDVERYIARLESIGYDNVNIVVPTIQELLENIPVKNWYLGKTNALNVWSNDGTFEKSSQEKVRRVLKANGYSVSFSGGKLMIK